MTAKILKLLADDEVRILQAYLRKLKDPTLDELYDQIGVPPQVELEPTRIEVAVAQILLNEIQEDLPNWGYVKDGVALINRKTHDRLPKPKLFFDPEHVVTINWANSGPGFSWPESYYITYLPTFNKFIVTSSRDGPDAFGCSDHAIGFADGDLTPIEAAREVITEFWLGQANTYDQQRWAHLFAEGLIDDKSAHEWADEVWNRFEFVEEDGDEESSEEDSSWTTK